MTTGRPDIEVLLRHQEWVRKLAHRLVADPATADDVAQETLLAAATRAPTDLREPRGWLRQVAQNAARAFARSTQRRTRREQQAAPPVAGAADATDPAVTLQRAAAHKRVVDVLFGLPEPYHTVLVLRFFDDLDVEAIAARLARPVATVRSQLQRGLARLREVLDGEFGGDRSAWCAALAPLLVGRGAATVAVTTTLGAMAMSKWITATAGVLLALMLGWLLVSTPANVTPPPDPAGGVAAASSQPRAPADEPAERRDDAGSASRAEAPTASLGPVQRGRLLTPEGSALPGLTLAWVDPRQPHRVGNRIVAGNMWVDLDHAGNRALVSTPDGRRQLARSFGPAAGAALAAIEGRPGDHPRAVTDGLGSFELATDGPGTLVLESEQHMLLGAGHLPNEPETIHVACPATTVAGIVRNDSGSPLAGAHVSLSFRLDALPGMAARLQGAGVFRSWNATTAADGSFSLGRVPVHAALAILAQKRGHEALTTPTTTIVAAVDWTLRTEAKRTPTLAGVVRHADGSPGAGARVDFGQDGGACDDQGRFTFVLTHWNDDTRFTAWVAGHEPAVLDGLGARLRQDANAGSELEVWLGGAAKTIAGRVLAADGRPLRGVHVAVVDATQAGSSDQTLESLISSQGEVVSDADGRFELRGLSSRSYHVRAVTPDSLLVLEATNVGAGTRDLQLRAAPDAFVARCEGQVVDQRGMPVANAKVHLRAVLRRSGSFVKELNGRSRATTDADGRFVLTDCPRSGALWTIDGEGLAWTSSNAPTDDGPVRLVVARRLKFRLAATSGAHTAATAFEIRDAAGKVLTTTERRPGVQSMHDRVRLRDTAVYEVDERAAVLVLFAGDRELGSVPLQLRTDDVTDVGF